MKRTLALSAFLILLLAAAAPAFSQNAADLYKSKCQMCHGADGKGNGAVAAKFGVRDFHSAVVAKESDQELFTITKDGKNKMPAYAGKLTDDQIKEQVAYIRSLK